MAIPAGLYIWKVMAMEEPAARDSHLQTGRWGAFIDNCPCPWPHPTWNSTLALSCTLSPCSPKSESQLHTPSPMLSCESWLHSLPDVSPWVLSTKLTGFPSIPFLHQGHYHVPVSWPYFAQTPLCPSLLMLAESAMLAPFTCLLLTDSVKTKSYWSPTLSLHAVSTF